jgi:ComF family protein
MLNDFISLIFPNVCEACEDSLQKHENIICTVCAYSLPKTNFHLDNNNPVVRLFTGRTSVYSASAFYSFNKEGRVQRLIHQLKYEGKKEIGFFIGKQYGVELKSNPDFNTVNTIIPVPLHPEKLKKRGYNQSEYFAKGLAAIMNTEINTTVLVREKANESQTKKSRYERWKNVEFVFQLKTTTALEGKHILLVDDVITTGATLEACANVLQQIKGVKISIATIAYANL